MNTTMNVDFEATAAKSTPVVKFVGSGKARFYDLFLALFVALLLMSNISATKLIGVEAGSLSLVFDGGAIMFPLTYILGDILSEVYGFKGARRAVFMGFAVSILASVLFYLVALAPAGPGDINDAAFKAIFGFVPRIVAASLVGYVLGQLLNAFVLVRMKGRTGERFLWARMIASTLVGELVDTVVFCTIAFAGLVSGADFLKYVVTGYVYKCAVEIIMSPISVQVIGLVKLQERNYAPIDTGLVEGDIR
ncbi:MAG: queuosine precursor transporter [Mobiluncus sp.]|uniref:queuosine precursor transporter n=1 Tax=Mobiluncus sp. TaxID=47293 RepID=UPI00258A072F|nr:queuosine precursor transporter [Mobiluncus sp.]MCI6584025.1 queuosine precursor transporter [Mobiluncus sp.]